MLNLSQFSKMNQLKTNTIGEKNNQNTPLVSIQENTRASTNGLTRKGTNGQRVRKDTALSCKLKMSQNEYLSPEHH